MNSTEIKIITQSIKSQLTNPLVAPLIISGKPGTGKSTQVQLIAKELGMGLVDISAPCLSTELLSGLPDLYRAESLDKYDLDNNAIATKWSIPEIIVDANKAAIANPNGAILLLDDFHMIGEHLQSYFFKLLLQRGIGNYTLDPKVAIIGTMNDSEEAGYKGINSAVGNRLAKLEVKFNFDHWFANYGKSLHYLVASFLKTKPHHITEDESTDEQYATARSWTAFAAELEGHDPEFIKQHARLLASMHVSQATADSFAKHVAYVSALDFSGMVASRSVPDIDKLSQEDPLTGVIHSYIVNFIQTVDDAYYLFDIINANIDEHSFVGFVTGELYNKYLNTERQPSEGVRFIIDKLLKKFDVSNYKLTTKQVEKATKYNVKHRDTIMQHAATYTQP